MSERAPGGDRTGDYYQSFTYNQGAEPAPYVPPSCYTAVADMGLRWCYELPLGECDGYYQGTWDMGGFKMCGMTDVGECTGGGAQS